MGTRIQSAASLAIVGISACAAPSQYVVLGRIYTADEAGTWAEAMAVDDGTITFVGSADDAQEHIDAAQRVYDLGSQVVLPGLHDVHQHTLESQLGVIACQLDSNVQNAENYIDTVAFCTRSPGTDWILGAGHSVLTVLNTNRAPRLILDDARSDVPIAILEETSHSTWVNTAALEALGIDDDTPDPVGGVIMRDADGSANGILIDAAGEWPWDLALAQSPRLDRANRRALSAGLALNAENGITSACDARVFWERGYLEAYQDAEAAGTLTTRMVLGLWAYPDKDDTEQIAALSDMYEDDGGLLRTSQVKLYSDGLVFNTTAALLQPYLTETFGPADGLNYFPAERLTRYVRELQAVGFDTHIHAIGDRGVREGLDAVEATAGDSGGADARHRLTHVELIHPDDVPRFSELGVYADMQLAEWNQGDAVHDFDFFIEHDTVEERAWPLRDLHESGLPVVLSSDYDVGSISPFDGIEFAVTRGAQSLPTVEDAVAAYTRNAALIMRSETRTGSLEAGKRADFVVIDQDIFAIAQDRISDTNVLWTVMDGDEVYRASRFSP